MSRVLLILIALLLQATVRGETPPEQAAAIKALRGHASNIQKNRDGTVRFVRFSKLFVRDFHLAHIPAFGQIDYLAVVTPHVTDDGLSHIRGLTNLDTLVLSHTQLSDTGLAVLEGLDKLEILYLDDTRITTEGLRHVAPLPSLKTLWLADTRVTSDGVATLAPLKTLEVLNLAGTDVDDQALAAIGKLSTLKSLYLDRTSITGATLKELAGLEKLEFLSLADTPLGDESAGHLASLSAIASLKQINLYRTRVTAGGITALRDQLKTLSVTLSPTGHRKLTAFERLRKGQPLQAAPKVKSSAQPPAPDATPLAPALTRFAAADSRSPVPDFQRHIVPLLGVLGCNGRACHGSFQGQGGFTLSMFGYDFAADHKELTEKDQGRIDTQSPRMSLVLRKPTGLEDHGGETRFAVDGWEYRLLHSWIKNGAKSRATPEKIVALEVTPPRIVFDKTGAVEPLRIEVTWENGEREDVTCLARFEVKDDQVAEVARGGQVTCRGPGDTHVLVMYDNAVIPVPVMMPVSGLAGDAFPKVPTPTPIDELVVGKLKQLGIEPSPLCSDEEFLRRACIDIAGTLPHHLEIDAFIKDDTPGKREQLIERLLGSEAYATWWSMFLTDLTGSNIQQMGSTDINWAAASQWEAWLKRRVVDNDGWDKIAAGMLLASSRRPDQSYLEYTQEQSNYLRRTDPVDAAGLDFPMHYYWFRSDATKPLERALSFGYIFLGVRLQCAQCHKHPFDRWSKQDFDQFTNVFSRVRTGSAPDSSRDELNLRHRLGVPIKLDTAALRRQMYMRVFAEGLPIPYKEVYIQPPGPKPSPARLLGGEELDINAFDDPREPLVEWLLRKDNPYFARAFVNRIWSRYFGRGIVDPPDDFNVGNPPSNAALLDWLAREFINHGYDMKWLHRTITQSRTYQLSSSTTATNAADTRHFSHAGLRRLPSEVIVDGILQATANNDVNRDRLSNTDQRRIGKHPGNLSKTSFDYALGVFGKPTRSTNCDCERTNQPTLLQSLYTRNDSEMLERIDRDDGWVCQVAHNLKIPLRSRNGSGPPVRARGSALGNIADEITPEYLTTQAYLRTLGRRPSAAETARCQTHFATSQDLVEGLQDLMWALLNTQEFLTNH